MRPFTHGFEGRYIVVADEDRAIANFVIEMLTTDGYAVFQGYDGLTATHLVCRLKVCDLLISNTRVGGVPGVELVHQLRAYLPKLPVLYLANLGRSTPILERRLPPDVPILREPFTAEELRIAVVSLRS